MDCLRRSCPRCANSPTATPMKVGTNRGLPLGLQPCPVTPLRRSLARTTDDSSVTAGVRSAAVPVPSVCPDPARTRAEYSHVGTVGTRLTPCNCKVALGWGSFENGRYGFDFPRLDHDFLRSNRYLVGSATLLQSFRVEHLRSSIELLERHDRQRCGRDRQGA